MKRPWVIMGGTLLAGGCLFPELSTSASWDDAGSGATSGSGTGNGGSSGASSGSGMGNGGSSGTASSGEGGGGADGGTSGVSGTGGSAGSSGGSGGSGAVGNLPYLPESPIGFASQTTGTTGGGGATPIVVTTASDLETAAAAVGASVIRIQGTIDVAELVVTSDKTLVGYPGATLNGGIRIGAGVSNVIIQNLVINGAATTAGGDAIEISGAHHVWLDHLHVFGGTDDAIDIVHGADYVTVSWTLFDYDDPAPDEAHRYASMVGHSDSNAAEDEGKLRVTYHHNWFGPRVGGSMPLVRFGFVHMFNNYFNPESYTTCVLAGIGARVLLERNYFDDVENAHTLYGTSPGELNQLFNYYTGDTAGNETAGTITPPTYTYLSDLSVDVPTIVMDGAGTAP